MSKNLVQKTWIAGLIVIVALLVSVHSAHALTVSPVRIELSADPGQVVNTEIKLFNDTEVAGTYYTSFQNFEAQGESGTPNFVTASEGLATWISAQDSIALPENSQVSLPVTIKVPANAEPGGYFAAVFFGDQPPSGADGQVSIGAKVGVLVLLSVNGDIKEGGGVLEFDTLESKSFYTSLPVPFFYRFQNSGNDRVKPDGDISIRHFLGFLKAKVPANPVDGNVLPRQTRRFETAWQGSGGADTTEETKSFFGNVKHEFKNFAFGYYTATLDLTYGADDALTASVKTKFWVVPWHLLIVVVVGLWLIRFIWKKYSKHHKASLMNEMRAEIKKELEQEKKTQTSGPNTPQSM